MRPFALNLVTTVAALLTALAAPLAAAKLPPLSDDAKAKAAEAAAKTAHGNKVADFQLCKAMDKAAAKYHAAVKASGKEVKVTETPPCADPGAFVATPPPAAPAASAPANKT
jgi:hypothetical protein